MDYLWPFLIICINIFLLVCYNTSKNNLFNFFLIIFIIQITKEIYWYFLRKKKKNAVEGVDTPKLYNKMLNFFTNKKQNMVPFWFDPTLRLIMLTVISFYFFKVPKKTNAIFMLFINVILYYLNTFAPIPSKPILILLIIYFCLKHYNE